MISLLKELSFLFETIPTVHTWGPEISYLRIVGGEDNKNDKNSIRGALRGSQ